VKPVKHQVILLAFRLVSLSDLIDINAYNLQWQFDNTYYMSLSVVINDDLYSS
jgi:hypothetical protein